MACREGKGGSGEGKAGRGTRWSGRDRVAYPAIASGAPATTTRSCDWPRSGSTCTLVAPSPAAAAPMSLPADPTLASLAATYTVERELGGGGMSRVFLARDVALGRRVVLKLLPPELTAGLSADRFRREIQVAAGLQHPHIVPL